MFRCPDCKTEEMVEVESQFVDPKGDGVGYEIPVYKCPKCDIEMDRDELLNGR